MAYKTVFKLSTGGKEKQKERRSNHSCIIVTIHCCYMTLSNKVTDSGWTTHNLKLCKLFALASTLNMPRKLEEAKADALWRSLGPLWTRKYSRQSSQRSKTRWKTPEGKHAEADLQVHPVQGLSTQHENKCARHVLRKKQPMKIPVENRKL